MAAQKSEKPARMLKNLGLLQQKVGTGPVDPDHVARSEKLIADYSIDFAPLAALYLADLRLAIADIGQRRATLAPRRAIQLLTEPVVHLKGNAGMFRYVLIHDMAEHLLNFLEAVREIDDDLLRVATVHCDALEIAVRQNMTGGGGEAGRTLLRELEEACSRYHARKSTFPAAIASNDDLTMRE